MLLSGCATSEASDFSERDLATTCIEATGIDPRACTVVQSGSLSDEYRYALYAVRDPVMQDTAFTAPTPNGVALFRRAGDRWALDWTESPIDYTIAEYQEPVLVERQDTILLIPVSVFGTGFYREDRFFLKRDTAWIAIDAESWVEDLKRRVPAGLEIWKGLAIDPASMTVTTDFWRPGDANCCPTGGSATAQLELRGTRFEVRSVSYTPPGP